MVERIYSFLGLATKAGKLLSGEETCERAIKAGRVYLVIVSEDASNNTKKKFSNMCSFRNTDLRCFGVKSEIGRHTGKNIRSVVVITEKNFAEHLKEMIDNRGKEHGGV